MGVGGERKGAGVLSAVVVKGRGWVGDELTAYPKETGVPRAG